MTDSDDRLGRALSEELERLDIPPPDRAARRRSIARAREEFEAVSAKRPEKSSQGFLGRLRLIIGNTPDKESTMTRFKQKLIYSGAAAALVGAVAVGIGLQYREAGHLPTAPAVVDVPRLQKLAAVDEGTAEGARWMVEEERDGGYEQKVAEPLADLAAGVPQSGNEAAGKAGRSLSASPARVAAPNGAASVDGDLPVPTGYRDVGRDKFQAFEQNRVKVVAEEPVSTFSADVDTASYSFVRRMLNQGVLPQFDAVRAEELINYFDYDYPLPEHREQPFRPTVTVVDSPWAGGRKLMHIGIKGYNIAPTEKPRSNLVFLLDVSGSMNSPDKLPLVKQSMELLLTTLNPEDTVAIVVYAGAAGTVLEPTPVRDRQKILEAMRRLSASGSTAGAQGIRLAYELAESRFDQAAINRVILATDGDFNVGISNPRELQSFIERKREAGIFLSVLGFGQGNYRDELMQTLAQNGNGVAAYIDTLSEAQKVLVDQATSTLFPIARDVKLQVEFNPATVAEYRLIGYETRHLNREDFNNDAVDAGDIGAGHTVTAIYEFTPIGSPARQIEQSRYAREERLTEGRGQEYAFLRIRYKLPREDVSRLITRPIRREDAAELTGETGFATAVAGFAQLLKGGKYMQGYSYDDVIELAQRTKGADPFGYRTEFVQLARKARTAAAMQAR